MTKPQKLAAGIGCAAVATGALALVAPAPLPWILAWTSASCVVACAAYVANRPGVYGKRDGRLPLRRALPTAVYLVAFRIACGLMRWWRRHPPAHRVGTGVWVAGRCEAHHLPDDVGFVVDLVAEFPEPRALREHAGYRFLAVLDGGVPPDDEAVLALLEELADPAASVLVHCDSGMGRAPTFAVLLLIRRGEARDVEEAIQSIRSVRPFVHLGAADRSFLARLGPRVAARAREHRRALEA